MTNQIANTIIFKGEIFNLIDVDGPRLFHPTELGMTPVKFSTSCNAGFYCTFELLEKELLLRQLTLREKNDDYVSIQGVPPTLERYARCYENLSLNIPYSGKIRIVHDFIQKHGIHATSQIRGSYDIVLDIKLEKGKIICITERSKDMKGPHTSVQDDAEACIEETLMHASHLN